MTLDPGETSGTATFRVGRRRGDQDDTYNVLADVVATGQKREWVYFTRDQIREMAELTGVIEDEEP